MPNKLVDEVDGLGSEVHGKHEKSCRTQPQYIATWDQDSVAPHSAGITEQKSGE